MGRKGGGLASPGGTLGRNKAAPHDTIAEYDNWSFLRYYLQGGFSFSARSASAGHFILWYGWIATAAVGGLAVAALAPKKLLARLPADLVWMGMIAAILAVAVYEKRWFG